ncbi:type II secretion system protein [bacterium]|nr:MAG: type II secretion system protein [bacterium]
MKNNKGFTLIEMLVVIAIIGLLSSVVLVALGPSRAKAKDARIISDMNQVRAVMETLYNPSTGKYVDASVATANTSIKSASDDMYTSGAKAASFAVIPATADNYYVAYVILNDAATYYCVDSTGNSLSVSAVPSGKACK